MAIKNEDGTVYKLKGVNPIMKTQKKWEKGEKFTLHNCTWQEEISEGTAQAKPLESDFKVKKEAFDSVEPEMGIKIEKPPAATPPQVATTTSTQPAVELDGRVEVYCLPALIVEHKDELYDEIRTRISYGNKFKFDAIIVEQNDRTIKLWSHVGGIETGSIVYPQNGEKRWWTILNKEDKVGGHLYMAGPSSINPDFSD